MPATSAIVAPASHLRKAVSMSNSPEEARTIRPTVDMVTKMKRPIIVTAMNSSGRLILFRLMKVQMPTKGIMNAAPMMR